MNRAERRRHDRSQRKQPVIVIGENVVVRSLGEQYEPVEAAQLPSKEPGEHRWVAVASFVVPTPSMIHREDVLKILGPHNMMYVGIGCYDCEEVWTADIGPCVADGAE
jgi:hypothetical protein